MKAGMVLINKKAGMTSQMVVSNVKRKLQVKKAGHIGTLDLLAEGVLPVLIGEATKLSKYLMEHDKTYVAMLQLGEKRNTGDREGNVLETCEVGFLDEKIVEGILNELQGKQKQSPHKFSAVKINGKKLYEYARSGQEVEIPEREIEIYAMRLLHLDETNKEITFEVACSKGTYIRVLCEKIAEKLGYVGYMKALQRTKVGEFSIQNAVTLENLKEEDVISAEELCQQYEKIELNKRKLELFLNGVMLTMPKENGVYRVYHEKGFVGLGVVKDELLKRDVIVF